MGRGARVLCKDCVTEIEDYHKIYFQYFIVFIYYFCFYLMDYTLNNLHIFTASKLESTGKNKRNNNISSRNLIVYSC